MTNINILQHQKGWGLLYFWTKKHFLIGKLCQEYQTRIWTGVLGSIFIILPQRPLQQELLFHPVLSPPPVYHPLHPDYRLCLNSISRCLGFLSNLQKETSQFLLELWNLDGKYFWMHLKYLISTLKAYKKGFMKLFASTSACHYTLMWNCRSVKSYEW